MSGEHCHDCPQCGGYYTCNSEDCEENDLCMECRIAQLQSKLKEAKEALRAMFAACDEWAAEFTQKKRGMNWGVVNDAYCKASKVLKEE